MKVRYVQTAEDIAQAYPCATESPTPFWAEGLPLSRSWFAECLMKQIHGFHLEEDHRKVIGHIYWAFSDQALVPYEIESGVAYMYCNWVQRQYRGMGGMSMLFQEWIEFLKAQQSKGILVDGTQIEGYMHYRHFLKLGFEVIREWNGGKLLYYPLAQAAVQVEPMATKISKSSASEVEVLVIGSRFCPVGSSALLSLRKVAKEFGERVVIQEIPASRETIHRYGVADGIFINGKPKFFGPVRENQVRQAIEEALKP